MVRPKVINKHRPPEDPRLGAGLIIRIRPSTSEKLRHAAHAYDADVGRMVNVIVERFLEEHGFYDEDE